MDMCDILYLCYYIDKVEKTDLVYSSMPTGSGAGISGLDVTIVQYEEVTGSRNKHVCNADGGYVYAK